MLDGLFSGILGLGSSIITANASQENNRNTNAANLKAVRETNLANYNIAQRANELQRSLFNEQMDYTRATQQEEWNRADSQLQRTVADAQSAGLSPLAVLSSGAGSSGQVVAQPPAPSMHVPEMIPAQMSPLDSGYYMSMQDMSRAFLDILKDSKHMSGEQKLERFKQEQENFRFEKQLRQTSALTNKQLNLQNSRESRQLQETIREFNATLENTITEQSRRYALDEADKLSQYVSRMTGGSSGSYKKYDNYDEYNSALRDWAVAYSDKSQEIVANYNKSKNSSGSGGVSFGVGPVHVGAQGSGSSGKSAGENFDNYYRHEMASWFAKNPRPVYIGK